MATSKKLGRVLLFIALVAVVGCTNAERQVEVAKKTNHQETPVPEQCVFKSVSAFIGMSSWMVVGNVTAVGAPQKFVSPAGDRQTFHASWVTDATFVPETHHFLARPGWTREIADEPSNITQISGIDNILGIADQNGNLLPAETGGFDCPNPENAEPHVGRSVLFLHEVSMLYPAGTQDFSKANSVTKFWLNWSLPVDANDNVDLSSLKDEPKKTVTLDELTDMVRDELSKEWGT